MFSFFKNRRRKRILATARVPDDVWQDALSHVSLIWDLSPEELERLRDLVTLFLAEKHIEGAGGLELTDRIRTVVAIQACLLVLGLGIDALSGLRTVILYPDQYRAPGEEVQEDGTVRHGGRDYRSGEAWDQGGPVILSWKDTLEGGQEPEDGYNVVIHEFAHKLDGLDRLMDGRPPLHRDMDAASWEADFASEYESHVQLVERGEPTLIDPYGAENPTEFFAVSCEAFFEMPLDLQEQHPRLYAHLTRFFRQQPAERLRDHLETHGRDPGPREEFPS